MLDVATAMASSALQRKESRGSHQRLDYPQRDDANYLRHTLASFAGDNLPAISYSDVTITKSQPAERVYGGSQQ
jgi:fumarate reductase flavoprotein subunit